LQSKQCYWRKEGKPVPEEKPIIQLTDGQKGYIAGVLDGEGWLGITIRKICWKSDPSQPHYHRPAVVVGQCLKNKILLEHVADILGHRDFSLNKERNFWMLRLHPPCLRWLLPQLLDHIILKRRQAEIIIDFITRCTYHGRSLSQEEWDARELLREEIIYLNRHLPQPGKLSN
jgi:hypothetical protein